MAFHRVKCYCCGSERPARRHFSEEQLARGRWRVCNDCLSGNPRVSDRWYMVRVKRAAKNREARQVRAARKAATALALRILSDWPRPVRVVPYF